MKMLNKIILGESSKTQLIAAFIGTAVGFLLLLGAVQIYTDINSIFEKSTDLINPDYIIINKKISIFRSTDFSKTEFTDKEIKDIRALPYIDDVAPFISNDFDLSGNTKRSSAIPYLYTELFFEAVPDKYLDIKDSQWKWQPGDTVIPVILPRDYLNLYNFGFAQSQGLPQVSPGMISLVSFDLNLRGGGRSAVYEGHIIGFTNRINSILVPYNFLKWANRQFSGTAAKRNPSRLLLVANDPSDPRIIKYLDDHGYETNREKLKNSRLNVILRIILGIVGIIASLIILLAFFVFVLGFQLMITKSRDKLKTLIHLGYNYLLLSGRYVLFFAALILGINLLSFIVLFIVKSELNEYLTEMGFELSGGISAQTYLLALILSILIVILNGIFVTRQVKKTAL